MKKYLLPLLLIGCQAQVKSYTAVKEPLEPKPDITTVDFKYNHFTRQDYELSLPPTFEVGQTPDTKYGDVYVDKTNSITLIVGVSKNYNSDLETYLKQDLQFIKQMKLLPVLIENSLLSFMPAKKLELLSSERDPKDRIVIWRWLTVYNKKAFSVSCGAPLKDFSLAEKSCSELAKGFVAK